MTWKRLVLVSPLFLAPVLAVGACGNTKEGVKEDAAATAETAKEMAEDAAKAAAQAAEAVASAAAEAGQAAAEAGQAAGEAIAAGAKEAAEKAAEATAAATKATQDAGTAMAAASETVDVKASLMADAGIDAGDIDVDTDPKTKTVYLKGSVRTDKQRAAAEKLAIAKATGYKVVNQLKVVPEKK
jgi:osmotically-inducible protein OsmY